MASILPGYEYDIFISYRQKDNKYDGWVTEFVNNLKKELEATFKEEISIYFDENPTDGILETYNVNKSLENKIKCLIFIPVISQTYCDPKSFAWQHEFIAFNRTAHNDSISSNIKLSNGNVTGRILPVKIHVLDPQDKNILENELGGPIRSIEFIYKSPGVNRPLKPDDSRTENLNHTYYRDQINKVANAVKEILTSLKQNNQLVGDVSEKDLKKKSNTIPPKIWKKKITIFSLLMLPLVIGAYFLIPKLSRSYEKSEYLEKSIAVLPFRSLSNDSSQIYFCDGFMEEILNNLQSVKEFTVRSRTSTDQYRKTTKTIRTIGDEMNVNYLIEGSVGKEDNNLKIWVQLINAKTDKHVWANNYTREMKQIFSLQSEIAKDIANELKTILSPEETKLIDKKPTENLEAYNYYLLGNDYFWRNYEEQNFEIAAKIYEKAIESDPNFADAYVRLSLCYLSLFWFYYDPSNDKLEKCKEYIDRAFKIDPDLPQAHLALGYYYYWGFLNYSKALEEIEISEKMLKNNSECSYMKGGIYRRSGKWSDAKANFLRACVLEPGSSRMAQDLARTCYFIGDYQEAEKYFNKAISLNPGFIEAIYYKSLMYMKWKGNTIQARKTIDEAIQINQSISNPMIIDLIVLMDIYDGQYQKALMFQSSKNIEIIEFQRYGLNLKSLNCARLYNLMNMPGKALQFYDSARVTLESRILRTPEDPRLYSTIGIAYAGLGLKEKAIEAGKKAVELMPINKEAYRGVLRLRDLARIYVMVGEYDAAIEQLEIVLAHPGPLSAKLLELDPDWKPLWNLPEFKRITKTTSPN